MTWVLALALGFAPTLSAFAAAQTGRTAPAAHVAHAGFDGASVSHADHAKVAQEGASGHENTSCAQHEQCSGKCCAACAQCFTAATTVPVSFSTVLAVYAPTEPSLHDRLTVAPHDRPPAV